VVVVVESGQLLWMGPAHHESLRCCRVTIRSQLAANYKQPFSLHKQLVSCAACSASLYSSRSLNSPST
jgi:hypothetical protein